MAGAMGEDRGRLDRSQNDRGLAYEVGDAVQQVLIDVHGVPFCFNTNEIET